MDDNIIAAIILAIAGVLGAILGPILGPITTYIIRHKRISKRKSDDKVKADKVFKVRLSKGRNLIIEIFLGSLSGLVIGFLFAKNIYKDECPAQRTIAVPFKMTSHFIPSGWMGDGIYKRQYVQFEPSHRGEFYPDGEDQLSIRVSYNPGPERWTGIYWQYPDKNWGDTLGIKIKKANHISFWAKGETGGEVVEFKSGGIGGRKYQDSYTVSLGKKMLSNSWNRFTLDLNNQDLSNVIGAFAWIASADDNPNGLAFYLDEIKFE